MVPQSCVGGGGGVGGDGRVHVIEAPWLVNGGHGASLTAAVWFRYEAVLGVLHSTAGAHSGGCCA
eukprot:COSAG01_NODE_1441_length_10293_cov_4.232392_12_plen_65_part_00